MASTPNDGSGAARIDFLRAESAIVLDVDMNDAKVEQQPHQQQQRQPPNSRRDYVARRMQLWEGNSDAVSDVEMGAISQLPLPLQVAFRCKMLTIFALQLLLVLALVGLCAFYPPVNDVVATAFQLKLGYLIAAAAALVVLLVVLYVIRALFPLNWLVLLLFTGAQAALFAALGVTFDTYVGVFNCGASFCCVVIMLLLAGVRRREPGEPPKLLSSVAAGLIAYVVVALAACALYVRFGRAFVTPEGFAASLAFQFALILWFALDAAFMYRVMSPDEYMHGVIYFYTDMILLTVVCVAAVVAALLSDESSESEGSDSGDENEEDEESEGDEEGKEEDKKDEKEDKKEDKKVKKEDKKYKKHKKHKKGEKRKKNRRDEQLDGSELLASIQAKGSAAFDYLEMQRA
ncbi:hypothetical protein PybrP1_012474 [[Pythium] brassicae (nom. inval.)]|nr:hypothetical protein PybrP1_012474 [[Pythium] brassicae (nom. inval.)]